MLGYVRGADLYSGEIAMSVMDHYVLRGMSGVPAPGGVSLPPGLAAFVDLFTPLLTQAQVDLLTAWSTRVDATAWEPNPMPPSTNVAIFSLTDQAVQAAQVAAFQQPVPFVGVLSRSQSTPDAVRMAAEGSAYRYYETQAVFSQSDMGDPPKITFLHWFEARQAGDASGGSKLLSTVASQLAGSLVFAMQVDYRTTVKRLPPTMSFIDAYTLQFGPPPGGDVPTSPPIVPVVPGGGGDGGGVVTASPPGTKPGKSSLFKYAPVGIAIACAVGAFFVTRAVRKQSRSP